MRTLSRSGTRTDTVSTTTSLTNVRARIVGDRTGFLADAIVGIVRAASAARAAFAGVFARAAAVITPLGWVILAVAPLAFLFGYRLGIVELVILGWASTALIVIAVLYLLGRSRLEVRLRMVHSRVVVGQPATAMVDVINPGGRRAGGVTVEIPVGDGLAEVVLPALPRAAVHEQAFPVPTSRRGVVEIGPARTVRADPVGLVRREVVWTDRTQLFIHPRTIGIPSMSTGLIRDLEGSPTRDLAASDVSFHALREYLPGDERRHIHWRSTARTGRYMVRQFEETRRSHLVVALSLAAGDYRSAEEFELAVSVTGSLGARAILDARTVSVVASERTPDFAKRIVYAVRPLSTLSRSRLLDDLAGVEVADAALLITDVARVTADRATGVSVAFLICGSGATAAQLRAASTSFPLGVEVLAVVCDADRQPGLRRIPGLSVLTIGYLEDLQQALSRSRAA